MNAILGLTLIAILLGLIFYWSKIPHKKAIVKTALFLSIIAGAYWLWQAALEIFYGLVPRG